MKKRMDGLFEVSFNSLWVVESPPSDLPPSHHSGQLLYETLAIKLPCPGYDELEAHHQKVDNKPELLDFLSILAERAVKEGERPIVHLDIAHGCNNPTGFFLANGDFIHLSELKEPLADINETTEFNLLLTVATCYGGLVAGLCAPPGRAPACAAIGPLERISSPELLEAYEAFYDVLLRTGHVNLAVGALVAAQPRAFNSDLFDARSLFSAGYQIFRLAVDDQEAFQQMTGLHPPGSSLHNEVRQAIGAVTGPIPEGGEARFERVKEEYFMLDAFPSNRQRFQLDELSGSI